MTGKNKIIILATVAVLVAAGIYLKYIKMKIEGILNGTGSQSANVKAFLMMIRQCEGTAGANGYKTMFGGKLFTDTSKHPNVCVPYKNTCSTAAGAYQFLYGTWRTLAVRLALPDFGQQSQDLAAIELIREKDALEDVQAGRVDAAINKVRKIWASLPGAGYGQPEKPLATARGYFKAAGGTITA